jgi:hypothetical protein
MTVIGCAKVGEIALASSDNLRRARPELSAAALGRWSTPFPARVLQRAADGVSESAIVTTPKSFGEPALKAATHRINCPWALDRACKAAALDEAVIKDRVDRGASHYVRAMAEGLFALDSPNVGGHDKARYSGLVCIQQDEVESAGFHKNHRLIASARGSRRSARG